MDQLRDNTGKKQKILARLKKNNARSAPFFWCALAWHL
jgi:hypothetical protein